MPRLKLSYSLIFIYFERIIVKQILNDQVNKNNYLKTYLQQLLGEAVLGVNVQ